jgi:ABC-type nitrate/sulfonate/bicarbonate transport system ATPase subunit
VNRTEAESSAAKQEQTPTVASAPASALAEQTKDARANEMSSMSVLEQQLSQPGKAPDRILRLKDVAYVYPTGLRALDSVNLDVSPGEVVGIVGPSGCGKSTLLSIIAGLLVPTEGSLEWEERSADAIAQQRRLSLVFQRDTLLPWLTVEKNVGFGLRYLRMNKRERSARISRLLRLAGLEDVRKAYPYQLSGGMRRRVAFLTGVATLPRVLLLDEPFSALDEPTRVTIHGEVLSIIKELGMTVLLVTHDLAEAISFSDRACILSARPGRIAAVHEIPFGYPRDVLAVRETTEYQSLYKALWRELSMQITKPNEARGDMPT